LGLFQLTVLAL